VVLTPRRWRQVGGKYPADDGDNKARSPGRSRGRPLKPLRAGMPGETGEPVVTMLVWFYFFPREAAGASSTRHSPRPHPFGGEHSCITRAHRAARTWKCVLRCLKLDQLLVVPDKRAKVSADPGSPRERLRSSRHTAVCVQAKLVPQRRNNSDQWLWVPAFAGTTSSGGAHMGDTATRSLRGAACPP
jgi:hypothetical protein